MDLVFNEFLDLDLTPHQCGDSRDFFFVNSIKIVKFTQYKSPGNIHCTGFHKGGPLGRVEAVQQYSLYYFY